MLRYSKILFPHLHQRKIKATRIRSSDRAQFHMMSAEAKYSGWLLHSSDGASVSMAQIARNWWVWLSCGHTSEASILSVVWFLVPPPSLHVVFPTRLSSRKAGLLTSSSQECKSGKAFFRLRTVTGPESLLIYSVC